MKKIIALIMAVLMTAALAACGGTDNDASSIPPEDNNVSTPGEAGGPDVAPAGTAKTGLGVVASVAESKSANEEKPASAQADVTTCAATFDENGTILSVSIDVAQCKVAYDEKGVLTTDIAAEVKTKKELGADYGMKKASGIEKEWDEQIAALEAWMTGKTVDEVLGMAVVETGDHPGAPDEADLKTSVTISVGDYLKALQAAYDNAK